jgi:hypothetical protein
VTHPDHLADEELSELVDDQLTPDEASRAQAHLGTCSACQARLDEMRELVGMLHALPSVEPPRDFRLGPRLVADPPNVIRLRRWYAWSRVAAGALAAVFVFLSVGTLYVDSRPVSSTATLASKAQPSAPTPAAQNAPGAESRDTSSGPVPVAPSPAARAAAPALAPQPPAAGGAPAVRSQAAPAPTSTEPDQVAAATTVRPLPTQVPTPTQIAQPATPFASAAPAPQPTDPAAPLRIAAVLVGVLAAFGILLALFVRHRLLAASPAPLE